MRQHRCISHFHFQPAARFPGAKIFLSSFKHCIVNTSDPRAFLFSPLHTPTINLWTKNETSVSRLSNTQPIGIRNRSLLTNQSSSVPLTLKTHQELLRHDNVWIRSLLNLSRTPIQLANSRIFLWKCLRSWILGNILLDFFLPAKGLLFRNHVPDYCGSPFM
jgi:hypothetical protein